MVDKGKHLLMQRVKKKLIFFIVLIVVVFAHFSNQLLIIVMHVVTIEFGGFATTYVVVPIKANKPLNLGYTHNLKHLLDQTFCNL